MKGSLLIEAHRRTYLVQRDDANAVFIVDLDGTIVEWSAATTQLLGVPSDDARGRKCWNVLGGLDADGGPLCTDSCPALSAARDNKSVPSGDALVIRHVRDGKKRRRLIHWHHLLLETAPGGTPEQVLHVLADVEFERHFAHVGRSLPSKLPEGRQASEPLTMRERDVFNLLIAGLTTQQVAESLGIRVATVRNHVARAMSKLGVRTRIAAVGKILDLDT